MSKHKTIDPQLLYANCSRITEEDIRYDFSPVEIADMRAGIVESTIEISAKKGLLKKIGQILNDGSDDLENELHLLIEKVSNYLGDIGLKKLSAQTGDILEKVRLGYEMRTIRVYEMDYSEEGRLEYYDSNGIFLWDKPVAGARQLQIKSSNVKTAN